MRPLTHEFIMEQDQTNDAEGLKWLFLDLNSYFASVEQQENPALRGKPVAVVPMMTDSTCAIAASYEAKAYGIKTGTKIFEAKRMCPGLRCVLARHDVYVDYHHRIFAEVENHLHVTKVCSVDEAACLLLGPERIPENAVALSHRIKQGLYRNIGPYIRCSIGLAPNAFLAKVASDMQKPDGLVLLTNSSLPASLFTLKLTDLPGINVNMERRLNRGGVFTVEQFWSLSPKHARAVWGSVEGERFWYALHGHDLPDRQTQKRVVGHSRVLDPNLREPGRAYVIAQRLTIKAATRLRRYNLYTAAFALKVHTVPGIRWANMRPISPAQDNEACLAALRDLWDIMLCETAQAYLKKVSISLFDLSQPEQITGDLFEQGRGEQEKHKNTALSVAMDRINRRYGANSVQLGMCPQTKAGYVGTKIAFTRIPDQAEFWE